MVEGSGGRWCSRYSKNFPDPWTGTIVVWSQEFEKSEKFTFFSNDIFDIFCRLDIIAV